MRKLGPAEFISLLLLSISFFTWLISSIFTLQAASGTSEHDLKEIKEVVKSTEERSQMIQIDIATIKAKLKE